MNDFILFLRAWWFPIFIAVFIFLLWLVCKIADPKTETCPFCGGSGKQWADVHDSQDFQAVNCEHCGGTGKNPKRKENKNGD